MGLPVGTKVLVEWYDSHAYGNWRRLEAWLEEVTSAQLLCESIGYVIRDDEHMLLLAQSKGDQQYSDCMAIPRVCVRTVTPIRLRSRANGKAHDGGTPNGG